MKRMTLLGFLLLGLTTGAHAQSLFVGNAGEGVVQGTQIYLRDLFEANAHLAPVIGDAVDPQIAHRLNERFSKGPDGVFRRLGLDRPLMARKLSDLNRLSPNLGFYVLDAFAIHRWHRLTPAEESAQYMNGHLILARRSFGLVSVEGWAWDRLSSAHRVALIVHEMLASFQTLDCKKDGNQNPLCEKNDKALRSLVGRLFQAWPEGASSLRHDLETHLAIPKSPSPMTVRAEEVFERIERLCHKIPHRFEITLERPPYLIRKEKYRRLYQNAFIYRDITFRFEAVASSRTLEVTPHRFNNDPMDCLLGLYELYMNWLSEAPPRRNNEVLSIKSAEPRSSRLF